jgi:hypothetical protein
MSLRACHVIRRSPDDNDLVRATSLGPQSYSSHAIPEADQTQEQCPLIRKRRAMTSTFLILNDRTAGTCRASYQQTLISANALFDHPEMRSCHYPGKVETEVEIKAKLNLSHEMTSTTKQRDQDKEVERVISPYR